MFAEAMEAKGGAMSYKDILVLVDADSDALSQYALSLATSFGAHVTAAALVVDPSASIGYLEASAAFVASALDKPGLPRSRVWTR